MVNWRLVWEWIKVKLRLVRHDPDYIIVISIKVTKNGEARISYDVKSEPFDILRVMDYSKKQIEQEIERKYGKIVKTKGKYAGMGEMEEGVLEKVTITKED
jgi:hypothetical protein